MNTSKLLQTLGLVGALAFAGASYKKTPFIMDNTRLNEINYEDGEQVLQFEDISRPYFVEPDTKGVINRASNFGIERAKRAFEENKSTQYRVAGYDAKFLGMDMGSYGTNIAPVRAESPVKVESD